MPQISMVLGHHFAHKIHLYINYISYHQFLFLATKQTLLSIEYWLIMACLDSFQIVRFTGPEGRTLDIQMNHEVWNPRCLEALYMMFK